MSSADLLTELTKQILNVSCEGHLELSSGRCKSIMVSRPKARTYWKDDLILYQLAERRRHKGGRRAGESSAVRAAGHNCIRPPVYINVIDSW